MLYKSNYAKKASLVTRRVRRAAEVVVEAMERRTLLSGVLDTTFSTDGKTTLDFGADDRANAVVVQPDGKILVAGSWDGGASDFAVARFNADGSLDTSFGGGVQGAGSGKTNVTFGTPTFGGAEFVTGMALQADGKIVVVGYTDNVNGTAASGGSDTAIARFNANGTLDTTFDGDGKFTYGFTSADRASGVVIQPDGKIVIAGTFSIGTAGDFYVLRLTTGGAFDPAFSGGSYSTQFFGNEDVATGVALQSNGKIVVSGYTNGVSGSTTVNDFAVARFNTDGTIDNTFDTDGKTTIDLAGSARANAVVVDASDRIVLAGVAFEGGADDGAVVRLTSAGALDTSFNTTGSRLLALGNVETLYSAAVSASGALTFAGTSNASGTNDLLVARLNTDGTFDSSFQSGYVLLDNASGDDQARAVALQPDDKVVVAGFTSVGQDMILARLTGDGRLVINGTPAADTITFNGNNYVYNGKTVAVDTSYVVSVVINGLGGADTLNANKVLSGARVTLFGGSGNDTLNVGNGDLDSNLADDVNAAGGFDPADALSINDQSDNDPGNTYNVYGASLGKVGWSHLVSFLSVAKVVVNLPGGNETVNLNSVASSSSIRINANGGNDTVVAGSGDFDANFSGNATVDGGSGTDQLIFSDATDAGDDTTTLTATTYKKSSAPSSVTYSTIEALTVNTGEANDKIVASTTTLPTNFTTKGGNDTVLSGSGNDTLRGGNGNDSLDGGGGNDKIFGEADNDILLGGTGNDTLEGSLGNDTLTDEAGNDSMYGGNGDDVYVFTPVGTPANNDTVREDLGAAGGIDLLDFSPIGSAVTVNLTTDAIASHLNRVVTAFTGTSVYFENVWGGAGADRFTGNSLANSLRGGGGNDTLVGNDNDDTLLGGGADDSLDAGNGNDIVQGDAGNDKLFGRAGNDSLVGLAGDDSLDGSTGEDTLEGGDGSDTLVGGSNNDLYAFVTTALLQTDFVNEQSGGGVDTLDFGDSTDSVVINLTSDTIATQPQRTVKTQTPGLFNNFEVGIGGSGNDSLTGNGQLNTLIGNDGNDTLVGNGNADLLDGGTGNDRLTGNAGQDKLLGGTGADTLFGADSEKDTLDGGADVDVLGNSDGIDVLVNFP